MADRKTAGKAAVTGNTAKEEPPKFAAPRYDWMGKSHQWGTRVRPGKAGLRLGDLNVGIYGEVPETWNDQTRMPRGAVPRRGVPPLALTLRAKHELWADSAADLYEEAIQRRWAPATDVPWDTIEQQPEDVERAICQICTELIHVANTDIESVSQWQHQMAYGYHEVKQYLATVTFDCARAMEVFRKRALVNGGGLGVESRGDVNRMILESRGGWTEAVLYKWLLRGTYIMSVYRYCERHARNEAEQVIFGRALQDKARHMTYALDHLKYAMTHDADRKMITQQLLFIGERIFVRGLAEPAFREALAIYFGGGLDRIETGLERHDEMMRDFVTNYLATCEWLGVPRPVGTEAWPRELAEHTVTADGAGA